MKNVNVVLIHDKSDKQTIENYHHVLLSLACGRIFPVYIAL